jgi:hypothetical protein
MGTAEIARVGYWSLRALGCPLGAAERMSRVLAVSEAIDGNCLRTLRQRDAELQQCFGQPELQLERSSPGRGRIDTAGRSLLDAGLRSADLLMGWAGTNPSAELCLSNLADTLGLAGICTMMVERGHAVFAAGPYIAGAPAWRFYALDKTGVSCLESTSVDAAAQVLEECVSPAAAVRWRDYANNAGGDNAESQMLMIAAMQDGPLDLADCVERIPGVVLNAIHVQVSRGHAHGVTVATEDLRHLYALEIRTWAPSSQRSREQAGFTNAPPSPG